jgi:peptide deformylase
LKLKICQAGETVLRRRACELSREEILSGSIQELIDFMRDTMRDAPGVGLAAPQVGFPLQIAVIEDQVEYIEKMAPGQAVERDRQPVRFHVIINPTLVAEGDECIEFFEGCLSVTGFTAVVPRAARVRVKCLNERAEPMTIHAHGWYARILQHEIDHLHGILYVDRMRSRSLTTIDNHARYWKDATLAEFWRQVPPSPE